MEEGIPVGDINKRLNFSGCWPEIICKEIASNYSTTSFIPYNILVSRENMAGVLREARRIPKGPNTAQPVF